MPSTKPASEKAPRGVTPPAPAPGQEKPPSRPEPPDDSSAAGEEDPGAALDLPPTAGACRET